MSLKSEYNKERARVEKLAKKLEKQGYTFGDNILPPIPKRPTAASIKRIAKINISFLRARAITQPEITAAPSIKRSSISQRKVKAPEIPKPTKTANEYTAKGKQQARPELEKFRKIGQKPYIPHPRLKRPPEYKSPIELRKAYTKQLSRVKALVSGAESRGYVFDEELLAKLVRTKSSTKLTQFDVLELKGLNSHTIYSFAEYVDPETGEVLSGEEGRELERKRSAAKGVRTKEWKKKSFELIPETSATPYPTEQEIGYNNLMSLLRTVSEGGSSIIFGVDQQYQRNATGMLNTVDRAIDTIGLRAFLELLKTPEGEYLLTKAYDAIFDSDDYQAREWCSHLEHLLHRNNLISDEELKQIQDERNEMWELVK